MKITPTPTLLKTLLKRRLGIDDETKLENRPRRKLPQLDAEAKETVLHGIKISPSKLAKALMI